MEMEIYQLTAEISRYEPGIGKGITVRNEYYEAPNDEIALEIAEKMVKDYHCRWTPWTRDEKGYERGRTAIEFSYSWMRVERIDEAVTDSAVLAFLPSHEEV